MSSSSQSDPDTTILRLRDRLHSSTSNSDSNANANAGTRDDVRGERQARCAVVDFTVSAGRGVQLLVGLCSDAPVHTFCLPLSIVGTSVRMLVPVRGAVAAFLPQVAPIAVVSTRGDRSDVPLSTFIPAASRTVPQLAIGRPTPVSSRHIQQTAQASTTLEFGRVPAGRRVSRRVDIRNEGTIGGKVWLWLFPAHLARAVTIDVCSAERRMELTPWAPGVGTGDARASDTHDTEEAEASKAQQEGQLQSTGFLTSMFPPPQAFDEDEERWRHGGGITAAHPPASPRPSGHGGSFGHIPAAQRRMRLHDNVRQLFPMLEVENVLVLHIAGRSAVPLELSMYIGEAASNETLSGHLVVTTHPPSPVMTQHLPTLLPAASAARDGAVLMNVTAHVDTNRLAWEMGEPLSPRADRSHMTRARAGASIETDQDGSHSSSKVAAALGLPSTSLVYAGTASEDFDTGQVGTRLVELKSRTALQQVLPCVPHLCCCCCHCCWCHGPHTVLLRHFVQPRCMSGCHPTRSPATTAW